MSSILKALEKVDESQRPRRSASGGIGRGRERRPAWLVPAWTLGGAAVAALITYALMGGFSRPAQVAEKTAQPAVAQAPADAVRQPVAEKPQPVAAVHVKPAQSAASPSPLPPHPLAPSRKGRGIAPAAKATPPLQKAHSVSNAGLQPAPVEAAAASAVVPEPAPQNSRPAIRVSGIAWQNSSEASFAMVNGRALRQGGVVEGYKVEQIYEDSVRFSNSKGSSLVVPLGAGDD